MQEALASITDQTAVAPLTDLINSLVDPDTGTAAGITGALEDLTATDGGLAALGELVVALTTADNAALAPLTDALAELLQGVSGNEGTPLGDIVSGLLGEDGALADLLADGGLGDLLGGLLPGGTGGDGDGLITTVQDALATITDQTALAPLTELVDTLLNPDSGVLGGLTSTLEDLTSSTGGLAALDDLVDALLTSDNAALAPVTAALNDILQGLTGSPNSPIGQVLEGVLGNDGPLASLLGDAGLGGLLGGLLGNGGLVGGLLGNDGLVGGLLGSDGLLGGLLGGGTTTGNGVLAPVNDLVASAGDTVGNLPVVGDLLGGALDPVQDVVGEVTGTVGDLLSPIVGGDFDPGNSNTLDPVDDVVTTVTDGVGDLLTPVVDGLLGAGATSGLLDPVTEQVDYVTDAVSGLLDNVVGLSLIHI